MLCNKIEFAEIQYFFNATVNDTRHTLALMSLYSQPDEDIFRQSNWTVWSVTEGGQSGLRVIDAKSILSVVSVIPHNHHVRADSSDECFFGSKWGWTWHCFPILVMFLERMMRALIRKLTSILVFQSNPRLIAQWNIDFWTLTQRTAVNRYSRQQIWTDIGFFDYYPTDSPQQMRTDIGLWNGGDSYTSVRVHPYFQHSPFLPSPHLSLAHFL